MSDDIVERRREWLCNALTAAGASLLSAGGPSKSSSFPGTRPVVIEVDGYQFNLSIRPRAIDEEGRAMSVSESRKRAKKTQARIRQWCR